jgi:3-deoxy-D-manno-octulosonate 8-phosphate phosphatase (KDO 8-P phosphatase)
MILSADLRQRLSRVRLLSLDVDGVQTDGGLYYSETGAELRRFHVRDGVGIKQVLAKGVAVVFITQSSTPSIVERARKLGVTGCLCGVDDKLVALRGFCTKHAIGLDEVAYMGDDINDIAALDAVGFPVTVADARPEVAERVVWRSTRPGGAGAVREFCDVMLNFAGK